MATEERKVEDGAVFGEKITTPVGRVSYPYIDQPDTEGQFAKGKYKISLLFPKDTDLKPLKQAIAKVAKEKWGADFDLKTLALPFRDGDEKDQEAYKGHVYITATTKRKPGVVGKDRQPLPEGDSVYGGCYARINVTPFTYTTTETVKDAASGKRITEKVNGVTFALNSVQFIRDGDPFGNVGGNAEADFVDDAYDPFPKETAAAAADAGGEEEDIW